MPLPNYGYHNKEETKHQDLVFQMAPEVVDVSDNEHSYGQGRKESRKKGRVTTGTIGIDIERKMVMHREKDANIWKPPEIDRNEVEEVKKYTSDQHKNLKKEVRSTLDSLISGSKVKQLQSNRDNNANSPIGVVPKSSFGAQKPTLDREITKTGVSIQPKGTYKLNSKKSLGSYAQQPESSSTEATSSSYSVSSSSYSTYSSSSGFRF